MRFSFLIPFWALSLGFLRVARHSAKRTSESCGVSRQRSGRWSSSCTGQRGRDSCHAGERGLEEVNLVIRRTTP